MLDAIDQIPQSLRYLEQVRFELNTGKHGGAPSPTFSAIWPRTQTLSFLSVCRGRRIVEGNWLIDRVGVMLRSSKDQRGL
jgi:hypothetical protein